MRTRMRARVMSRMAWNEHTSANRPNKPTRVGMLRLGSTRSYTCSMNSEPLSINTLMTPVSRPIAANAPRQDARAVAIGEGRARLATDLLMIGSANMSPGEECASACRARLPMRAPWLPAVSASWDASAAQPGSSPGQAFRGHALDQGLVERCDDVLNDDVVAGAAVEHVDPATADQHVIAGITSQDVVAGTADQDVVAVAAVGGEQQVSGQSRRFDDIVADERIDH